MSGAMTMHVGEDELVLHYYGELPGSDETRVASHLAQCGVCHADFRRLQRVLLSVDEAALPGPELPESFERTTWARLEPALAQQHHAGRWWWARPTASPAHLGWAAAALLLAVGAFFAGRMSPGVMDPGAVTTAGQMRESILLVDLGDHLDRSQRVLVELMTSEETGAVDVTGERDRAVQLVASSRLYRETAAATGDASVVALLDQLERVLVDLATTSTELSAEERDEVRRRIESGGLLFKVRVVSSDLQERWRATVRQTGQRSSL